MLQHHWHAANRPKLWQNLDVLSRWKWNSPNYWTLSIESQRRSISFCNETWRPRLQSVLLALQQVSLVNYVTTFLNCKLQLEKIQKCRDSWKRLEMGKVKILRLIRILMLQKGQNLLCMDGKISSQIYWWPREEKFF